jgi:hypothetical protein
MDVRLQGLDRKLFTAHQPMHGDYAPELDVTPHLDEKLTYFYQSQISILRWIVELGQLDIYFLVSVLSSYLAQPRMGHLEAVYFLYGYLKAHDRSMMVFDDKYVNWNDDDFSTEDSDFYRDSKEETPCNAPEPRGMPVQINAFIDASHARNDHTQAFLLQVSHYMVFQGSTNCRGINIQL